MPNKSPQRSENPPQRINEIVALRYDNVLLRSEVDALERIYKLQTDLIQQLYEQLQKYKIALNHLRPDDDTFCPPL